MTTVFKISLSEMHRIMKKFKHGLDHDAESFLWIVELFVFTRDLSHIIMRKPAGDTTPSTTCSDLDKTALAHCLRVQVREYPGESWP